MDSLPLLLGPLSHDVVKPVSIPSMGQIDPFKIIRIRENRVPKKNSKKNN